MAIGADIQNGQPRNWALVRPTVMNAPSIIMSPWAKLTCSVAL
jgi:hypothetical protein